jgi:hypothetical protein
MPSRLSQSQVRIGNREGSIIPLSSLGRTYLAVNWNSLVNCVVNTTTVNKNAGGSAFNAAARDTGDTFTGAVEFQFEVVGNSNGFIAGLTSDMVGSAHTDVEYGFNNSNVGGPPCRLDIYEAGTLRTLDVPSTYIVGDILSIIRTGDTIKYYKNGALVHTSAVSASGKTLTAMVAAFAQGDQIKNAFFVS